ncbi:hydroxyacid dehydrogenase [Catenuloplanes nepalensis]|uniref:hydroxyacid dehydrogenase n=1 Tax=Catenuloplanes nepalensis TaxID=587533 RepID=UPI0027D88693|nr:hydroxyacid dehydrogenase [Catenuloplanes nepalensis]
MTHRPTALFAMDPAHFPALFPPALLRRIRELVDVDPDLIVERFDDPRIAGRLADLDFLITGWGSPPVDEPLLDAAPRLRAVLHAAGSVKHHVTEEAWARGVVVSSAAEANAVPVAEFALAFILLAGKGVLTLREQYRESRRFTIAEILPGIGNYGRVVGIVGASRIGRQVIDLLRPHDVEVLLYDPYTQVPGTASVTLPELLTHSDVVSLHAPANAETFRMIGRDQLRAMRDGAVLINTARGALVDTDALTAELATGRIAAVLDVTEPEPLPAGSPLFDLPNAYLTPHVAGSHGNELARLGASVADELERLVAGVAPRHGIQRHELDRAA